MNKIYKHYTELLHTPMQKLFVSLALAATTTSCTTAQQPSVYEQIIQNVVATQCKYADVVVADEATADALDLLDKQGAFTDIDYSSRSQTNWAPIRHTARLQQMALSYVHPDSRYYKDKRLHQKLVKMLKYWYEANPISTNWWNQEIGWPCQVGLSLALLRAGEDTIPHKLEQQLCQRMQSLSKGPDQPGSPGTGANKMDIAYQWFFRTCLQEDSAKLDFSVKQFFYPIKYNEGQGIQCDHAYLQHGQQLYTGGYGAPVMIKYAQMALFLKNTPFQIADKKKIMSDYIRYGYLPGIRGEHILYNLMGRSFARKNSTSQRELITELPKMMEVDPAHAADYADAIARMAGTVGADYHVKPYHHHFWRGDYTLHQRPQYTLDVRTASTRLARCENGNLENLHGYFMTEGGSAVVRRGDEYENIYPVWDWTHIPGTTSPVMNPVPRPKAWENLGQSLFTGGVSDGQYGVTTYQMRDQDYDINSSGKKSWFFFDHEVVCMGVDLHAAIKQPLHTTVNQCLLHGDVMIQQAGDNQPQRKVGGEATYQHLRWVQHDSISYYFPADARLTLRNAPQQGSWNFISNNNDTTTLTKDVFKLYIDHGVQPKNGSYLYYILPNHGSIAEAESALDDLQLLNTSDVQAVYNRSLHQLGVVFHKPATVELGGMTVTSDAACVALFTQVDTDEVKVYLADPSYQLKQATLTARFPKLDGAKRLDCTFKTDVHYAGSTHAFTFSVDTPNVNNY